MEEESSPDTSRPSSPAQSDATEVPDFPRGPRSVANDIEHIKSLISRADNVPRAPEASITAQVFRSRSGSTGSVGPVSQQRIFHELDLLKKRIRNEQQHVRRPSQIDPETESESEDAIDEREEELENIREQLVHERRQSEDLIANAEFRIDGLLKEKEDLTSLLHSHRDDVSKLREELETAKTEHGDRLAIGEKENESLRDQLQTKEDLHIEQIKSAEARMAQMQQQLSEWEQRTTAAEASLKKHEAELHEKLAAREHELADVQGHLAELQQKLYDSSAALREKNAELSEATEHAYRMFDESDKAHDAALQDLRDAHAAEVAGLRAEHDARAAHLEQGWSQRAADAARLHAAELSSAQIDLEAKLARLRADPERRSPDVSSARAVDGTEGGELEALRRDFEAVKAKLASAQEQNWNQLIQFQEKHKKASAFHAAEKDALEREHRNTLEDLEAQNEALERQVNELKTLQRQTVTEMRSDSKALGFLEDCTRQLQKVHAAEVEGMRNQYDSSLRQSEAQSIAQLKSVRQGLEEALEFSKAEGVVALDSAYRDYEESIRILEERMVSAENTTKAQLAELDGQHKKVLDTLEASRQDDMESLQQEHERAVRMLLRNHKSELSSLEETHQQQLSDLEESLRSQNETEQTLQASKARNLHQKTVENFIQEAQESAQEEIAALKKSHKRELSRFHAAAEEELASALANADDDLEERLRAQEEAHRKELDQLHSNLNVELTHLHVKLEEAAQLRDEATQESAEKHQTALDELGQKLDAAEQTSRALQARLDAESVGRAEAERSLAVLKKQRFEEERTPTESKANLRRSIVVLEAERDSLAQMLAGPPPPSNSDPLEAVREVDVGDDVNSTDNSKLKQKLVAAERERDEAQRSAERKIDEMTRQTDFLVKELEAVMAQRSAENAKVAGNTDASVQTDPVAVLSADALKEPKADAATSRALKLQQVDLAKQVKDAAYLADKRRSFEDYLVQAQAVLSSLGSITNANETLFVEKTQEHAGELQMAKEKLSLEYQRKFRALQAEKERMERAVSAKSAADFTREHMDLFDNYGINHDEPGKQAALFHNLPARKKRAIRNAEHALVAEYHRRLSKRKSQIAMKHAEKFHSLTQEFHQKTAEIVGVKDDKSNGVLLPRESTELNGVRREEVQDVGKENKPESNGAGVKTELENALKAASNTTPKSQLPKRISISAPRTVTSIPRAVPFVGRPSLDLISHPERSRTTGDVHISALNTSPSGPPPPPPKSHSDSNVETVAPPPAVPPKSDMGVSQKNSSISLSTRAETISREVSHEKNASTTSVNTARSRPRTMRHSSRMIFGMG